MSYTEVTLVRHASATHMLSPEIIAGRAPYSVLTEEGVRQSRQLGEAWAAEGYHPDVAHTSPLIRAQNTLQLAQLAGSMPFVITSRGELAEQCLGYHEGKPRGDIYTPYLQWMIELQGGLFRHQGVNDVEHVAGESLRDASRRIASYVVSLRTGVNEAPKSVVAMSHKIALQGFFGYIHLGGLEGSTDPHELQKYALDRGIIDIAPCAQSLVIVEGGPEPESVRIRAEYIGQTLTC